MPAYTITTGYSSPAPLSAAAHREIGAVVEAAAVAQLRLSTGVGDVPPTVADALALIRAWHGGQGMPIVANAVGGQPAIITNVGD